MDAILRFFRHYGLSICVGLTILYLCMKPAGEHNMMFGSVPNIDKVVHCLMYFGFTFCICLNFYQQSTSFKSVPMIMWALIIPILYGGLIEIMQEELTATRSCDLFDFFADSVGSILGYFFSAWYIPKHFKENEY
ncbi:MAG: VanZ family protein [Paludibacteraceae bacterium]|nr:VanZ family protein [Paludibacteraceae bacterium]